MVLFDEIEKAHPDIQNILLQIWRTASSPMPWAARPISAIPSSCSPLT
ncbi:MAG: AAA family ATPase [Faecalibacterium prausnitzii]